MVTILLCGSKKDAAFVDVLLPVLSAYGGVLHYNGDRISGVGDPRFFLCECERLPDSMLSSGLLLFKSSFCCPTKRRCLSGLIPILDTGNTNAAHYLKGTGVPAITIGMSSKDTVSLAGCTDTSAAVSLLRSVRTLGGNVIEPGDFKIQLHTPLPADQVLLFSTILLLSDEPPGYCL